jgi:hypothetical protein
MWVFGKLLEGLNIPKVKDLKARKSPSLSSEINPADQNPITSNTIAAINFLDFPTEIRLQIYSELLVQSTSIVIKPPRTRTAHESRTISVYVQILRASKRVHSEASPLLYSKNRIQCPDFLGPWYSIAPFLRQIGSQTQLIRHMCIHFPEFRYYGSDRRPTLGRADIFDLELIRSTCTSITTLELSRSGSPLTRDALSNVSFVQEAVDLLDTRLKAIPSLKNIIVTINMLRYEYLDYHLSGLMNRMRQCEWTIELIRNTRMGPYDHPD